MLFLNSFLLLGLAGAMIPIILHLIRRQAAKPIDWGAMRFLFDTVAMRRRRMEWEDLLLMATRCLLITLVALALARPFIPPNSTLPWLALIPLIFVGISALAGSFVLARRQTRLLVRATGLFCLLMAAAAVFMEHRWNLRSFRLAGSRDIALVIDGSTSMTLSRQGQSAFDHALEEAREVVKKAPRGTAFSVILGGPAPELKTATPLTHRADVLDVLEKLRPVGGTFRAQDAIGMATLSLAEGENGSKEILLFSDGQRLGWRTDTPSAWNSLGKALESLPRKPRLMVRTFSPPPSLRNLAIRGISLSRDVVGTDRKVSLRVSVENTGSEAATARQIELSIQGKPLKPEGVGQLIPGQQETVEFLYRFPDPGPQVVTARLEINDAIPSDDHFERVVLVRNRLPVLLVDGHPTGGFFDRAAGFTALALAPTASLMRGDAPEKRYLMEPSVLGAPALSKLKDLPSHGVIVLADVPRLPATVAQRIESFVADGGGLLILAGSRADASFYNAWEGGDGRIVPAHLLDTATAEEGISPAPSTFDHPALSLFADEKKSDLGLALISVFRKVDETGDTGESASPGGHVVARFSQGAPFLTSKNYGLGRVMLATCRFDSSSGNLPAKQSFVPFIHETITWLAGAGEVNLNLTGNWSPTLSLPGGSGLLATYFHDKRMSDKSPVTRITPMIDFDWGRAPPVENVPARGFAARWTGRLLPPVSGNYTVEIQSVGRVALRLDGQTVIQRTSQRHSTTKVPLTAGRSVDFSLEFLNTSSESAVHLFWTPPGGTRTLIPASALLPPVAPESGAALVMEETEATDPMGAPRPASLTMGRRGRLLKIDGPAIPGLYQFKAPKETAEALHVKPGAQVPLVVTRDIAESRLDLLTDDDRALIGKHLNLVKVRNLDDILAVLQGRGFGEELWKIFALAALVLLLAEVALARWISRSRRAGDDVRVDFKIKSSPDHRFGKNVDQAKGDTP